ncbi:MAG: hypothetical protein ACLRWP_17145 [Bilophila wadsworthia]
MHGEKAEIGVLTASSQALTPAHFANCATPMESVHIRGMEGNPEFWETIIEGKRHDFDMERLEAEIVGSAAAFAREKALDALVLECTDLSAFSAPIQRAINLPVRHQFARRVRLLRRLPEGLLAAIRQRRFGCPASSGGISPLLSEGLLFFPMGVGGIYFSGRQGSPQGGSSSPQTPRQGNDSLAPPDGGSGSCGESFGLKAKEGSTSKLRKRGLIRGKLSVIPLRAFPFCECHIPKDNNEHKSL